MRGELEKSEAAVDDFRRQSGLIEVKGATVPAERLGDLNSQLSHCALGSSARRSEVADCSGKRPGREFLTFSPRR